VSAAASADELMHAYEALRAEALGQLPALTPRGRGVLLRGGLVAWMRALPPLAAPPAGRSRAAAPVTAPADGRRELVDVLAAMALGAGRGWSRAS
jgi:hypothetical protein